MSQAVASVVGSSRPGVRRCCRREHICLHTHTLFWTSHTPKPRLDSPDWRGKIIAVGFLTANVQNVAMFTSRKRVLKITYARNWVWEKVVSGDCSPWCVIIFSLFLKTWLPVALSVLNLFIHVTINNTDCLKM